MNDEFLPDRKCIKGSTFFAWLDFCCTFLSRMINQISKWPANSSLVFSGDCIHPNHPDIATKRNGSDGVLGLADLLFPNVRSKANSVFRDLYPELFSRNQVAKLMQGDRKSDNEEENEYSD
jgi:hypothetical protein